MNPPTKATTLTSDSPIIQVPESDGTGDQPVVLSMEEAEKLGFVDPDKKSSKDFTPPSRPRQFEMGFNEKVVAPLKHDLPRSWERTCFRRFRKDDLVTITGIVKFKNGMVRYTFEEGARGGYCLQPSDVEMPKPVEKQDEQADQEATSPPQS